MATGTGVPELLTLKEAYFEGTLLPEFEKYRKRRWGRLEEMQAWLEQESLASLTGEQAATLFRASGARGLRAFQNNSLEEIRDALDFLLYDTITLEGRFAECAATDGSYNLAGAGKEFISYLLCLRDPQLFGVWQPYTAKALKIMGRCPKNLGMGHLGLGYLDLLDALQRVGREAQLRDFRMVDEFCFAVGRGLIPTR